MKLEQYLSQNPKKYLIFDLDGTIAKLHMDWNGYRRSIWDLVAQIDQPLTIEFPYGPQTSFRLTNEAVRRHGEKAKKIINDFVEKWETTHCPGYSPNPDLISFIKIQKQYVYYIWSNQCRATIEKILIQENIKHAFQLILTRENMNCIKPDPEGFNNLIFHPDCKKSEYLMIGDLPHADGVAASSAGIDFFQVDYFKSS